MTICRYVVSKSIATNVKGHCSVGVCGYWRFYSNSFLAPNVLVAMKDIVHSAIIVLVKLIYFMGLRNKLNLTLRLHFCFTSYHVIMFIEINFPRNKINVHKGLVWIRKKVFFYFLENSYLCYLYSCTSLFQYALRTLAGNVIIQENSDICISTNWAG